MLAPPGIATPLSRNVTFPRLPGDGPTVAVNMTDDPPVVPGGWTYHLDRKRVVAGGALSNGGNVITWLAETFPSVDLATLWRGDASADDVIALPLLAGDFAANPARVITPFDAAGLPSGPPVTYTNAYVGGLNPLTASVLPSQPLVSP